MSKQGIKNLKPIASVEEAREKGRKGGIASAKSRAVKKTFKQLALDLPEKERKQMFDALVEKAEEGSLPHLELYLEIVGEHPKQDTSASDSTITINIAGGDDYGN